MKLLCSILIATVIVLSGCGSDPVNPDQPVIEDGFWMGTTSTGDTISFTVTGDSVKSLQVKLIYLFPLSGYTDTVTWNPDNALISNDAFSMTDTIDSNPAYTLSLSGTFSPPDQVSGDVSSGGVYHPDSSTTENVNVDLSWTASHHR
jgi:hypothetical protein